MDISCKTDVGKKRVHNEDSLIVDDKKNIFIVADGMGGHKSGEWASKMAVEVAYDYIVSTMKKDYKDKEISSLLRTALIKAHETIKLSEKLDFNFKGMGTTLVLMLIRENKAFICHVRDSRAYLISGHIRQITKDQTLGNYLMEHEHKNPEEIPLKAWHTITQAVGVSEKLNPELNCVELKTGDIIILCSDGLTDMLTDNEIEAIVKKHQKEHIKIMADILVKLANSKGGKDNVSVVVVRY